MSAKKSISSAPLKHRILIYGAGVVGQATGEGLAAKGHKVSYIDIKESIISSLRARGRDAELFSDKKNAGREKKW